jgi:hypothetical protein
VVAAYDILEEVILWINAGGLRQAASTRARTSARPGERIADPGEKVAKHAKPNSEQCKLCRRHRILEVKIKI